MTTHLTTKGQVTIPKSVRDYLGLKAGSAVTFERSANGEIVMRPAEQHKRERGRTFSASRHCVAVRMTTEEILALTRGNVE